MFLRSQTSKRCRQQKKPLCSDNSDVTDKTCAWACLHYTSKMDHGYQEGTWSCPGEAKCIGRRQICDGVSDCGNGQDEDKNLCTRDFCNNGFVSYDSNRINLDINPDHQWYTDLKEMKQDYLFDYYRIPDYPSNQIDYYRTHETDLYREKMEEMIQKLEMGKCENSTKCRRETWNPNECQ